MTEVSKSVQEKVEVKSIGNEAADHKTYSGKSFIDVDHFVNEDKQYLFRKIWMPKCEPKALLMLLHGYSEHCGYFDEIAEQITDLGVLVFAHDYVGHGESEGIRADVTAYEVYTRDSLQHIKIMKEKYPHLPLYMYGHAMNGGIAIILAGENAGLFKGFIISAPVIVSYPLPTGIKLFIMKLGSLIVPQMDAFHLKPTLLTGNSKGVEKYKNDPLVYHGKIKLRMLMQFVRLSKRARELLPEITTPVLVLHGDKDVLCDISGPEELMRYAKCEDKTLKIYEGAFHEPFHEIDDIPQRFLNDIKEWLHERLLE